MPWTYNTLYQRLTTRVMPVPAVGPLTTEDAEILRQAAEVYREFGEWGLQRYYEELERRAALAKAERTTTSPDAG